MWGGFMVFPRFFFVGFFFNFLPSSFEGKKGQGLFCLEACPLPSGYATGHFRLRLDHNVKPKFQFHHRIYFVYFSLIFWAESDTLSTTSTKKQQIILNFLWLLYLYLYTYWIHKIKKRTWQFGFIIYKYLQFFPSNSDLVLSR